MSENKSVKVFQFGIYGKNNLQKRRFLIESSFFCGSGFQGIPIIFVL